MDEAFASCLISKMASRNPCIDLVIVAGVRAHPRGLGRPGEHLFRFHRVAGFDFKLIQARAIASGLPLPLRLTRRSNS